MQVKGDISDVLMIIAPRVQESADALEQAAREIFEYITRRSKGHPVTSDTEIYIADSIGEMGLWYRLAPVSFVGHSLGPLGKPLGGKNPFEAVALNSVIIHWPAVEGFAESYAGLQQYDAPALVKSVEELAAEVVRLLEPTQREGMLKGANDLIAERGEVLDLTWDTIAKALRDQLMRLYRARSLRGRR